MRGNLARFRRLLLSWYRRSHRNLPWRIQPGTASRSMPDPYHVLVSEAMLQQTQVATAILYFRRFIQKFPTLAALATARQHDVLLLWQGLGYYGRALRLLETARIVAALRGGQLPSSPEELMSLPGIGRYTAGAIASLAFGKRVPILDGNVKRVLCRLDRIQADPTQARVVARLWSRAAQILPARLVADFNSALMELGATTCTARRPRCTSCPVRRHCEAMAGAVQQRIPRPSAKRARPVEQRCTYCIHRGSRWLIEQRPSNGRWAGLWQFPTIAAVPSGSAAHLAAVAGLLTEGIQRIALIRHDLSHRRYEFQVYLARAGRPRSRDTWPTNRRRWARLDELSEYPLSLPQQRIAAMLRDHKLAHRATR